MKSTSSIATTSALSDRELLLTCTFDAPPEKVYRAWTEPELIKLWFAPRPYTVASAEVDVRPGGLSDIVMRSPEGADMPCPGVYLEIVPNRRLVSTDAYTKAWQPSEKPFMTVVLTFEPAAGGKTNYSARVLHWTAADREQHEKMGFHTGWSQCADQLAELLTKI